jgi:hypothetical protein
VKEQIDEQTVSTHPILIIRDVVVGWILAGLVFSIGFGLAWTNHLEGLFVGVFHWVLMGITYVVIPAPILGFASWFLRRRNRWKRFVVIPIVAPAALLAGAGIVDLIFNPPTANNRLADTLRTKSINGIKVGKAFFSGGGLSDKDEIYLISGPTERIDHLVKSARFERTKAPPDSNIYWAFKGSRDGFPDPTLWEDATFYENDGAGGPVFLVVDKERTHAMIVHYTF